MKYNFDKYIDRRNTDCEKWDGLEEEFGRKDLLAFWVADMDFPAPPEVLEAVHKKVDQGALGYPIMPKSLYDAIRLWEEKRHGWKFGNEAISWAPGVVAGLSFAVMALTKPGDGVIIQTPVYPPFFDAIRDNERKIVENPLVLTDGRYEIDFADLKQKLADPQNTMLLLCSPHNPSGRVWSQDELRRVRELCRQYDVEVLSDEIHSDLVYAGHRHTVFATLGGSAEEAGVTFMAASKTFNVAGLNLSFTVVPDSQRRAKIHAWINRVQIGRNNLFGVLGTEAAYRTGEVWLEEQLRYLAGNADSLVDFVQNRLPGVRVHKPEATYLAWLDFRDRFPNARKLRYFLAHQAEVGLNPGETFGSAGEGFARLNFATQRGNLLEALTRIEKALKQNRAL